MPPGKSLSVCLLSDVSVESFQVENTVSYRKCVCVCALLSVIICSSGTLHIKLLQRRSQIFPQL